MAVAVGHQLVGFLGGRIQADRVVHRVADGERHLGIGAIDAGRAGIDQMADLLVAARLEDVEEADQVAVRVGMRVLQRVADAGLCCEVQHALRAQLGEQPARGIGIRDVGLDEAEALVRRELRQAGVLQARVVIIVQVVDADHRMAFGQEPAGAMHANEAGRTGHDDGGSGAHAFSVRSAPEPAGGRSRSNSHSSSSPVR